MEGILTKDSIESDKFSVVIAEEKGSETLLISFGGIANRLPIPVFEFMNSLQRFNTNKIFIKDLQQCWYTNGIKGITKDPDETIEYLNNLINKYGRKRTIFIGNSAGAYAALLYGQILQVNEVHAFSPQTFIDWWHRLIYIDRRWKPEIAKLSHMNKQYFDLKSIFSKYNKVKSQHHIYWDKRHRLDNIHALRLNFDSIFHHSFSTGGHAVIKHMRDSGILDSVLERSFK